MSEEVSVEYKDVADELVEMGWKDQQMRINSQNPGLEVEFDSQIDIDNTRRLRKIVEQIGWPAISKVGDEASWAAWLLVQHADHDREFQVMCLELTEKLPKGDVDPANIAYLTDRVSGFLGRKQLYGTQFHEVDDKAVPLPIEDEAGLDERREKMGLMNFSDYKKRFDPDFKWPEGYKNPMVGRFSRAGIVPFFVYEA